MLPWVKAGAAQGIISSAQVVGEINEADAQRAESNGVGKGAEEKKLGGRDGGEGEAGFGHSPTSCVLPPEF